MPTIVRGALIATMLTLAGAAQAATYVRDAVVDLSQNTAGTVVNRLDVDQAHIAFAATPALANGDIVRGTVTFANTARVTLYDDARESVQFWLANSAAQAGNVTSTFSFNGLSGSLKTANLFTSSNTGCCAAAGPAFTDLTDSSFSFSGFDYAITFVSGTSGSYDGYTFFTSRARYDLGATPAVPEPATWAMLLLGLGGVGHVLRRRSPGGVRIRFS